ncbi:MAG: anthranilate synthase component I family protein [Candidatus Omnitrophica bacterium]|nr:anthranilate synthase component I family protein [Candidatus Omnitrophota bacterium]
MKNYISDTFAFSTDASVLLEAFAGEPYCFLLDSSLSDARRGRYSFFGFDPFDVYRHKNSGDLNPLRQAFERYQFINETQDVLPAGLVGFLAYDHGLFQEKIPLHAKDDLDLPDCLFGFYDCILSVDHVAQTMTICSSGYPEQAPERRLRRAHERLDYAREKLERLRPDVENLPAAPPDPVSGQLDWQGNFTRQGYERAVGLALEHIAAGDIYQVNLSQRFSLPFTGDAQSRRLYHLLRGYSPSHFGVYFDGGDYQLISSSPERYLQLRGQKLLTQPMKGTRPRGANPEEDQRYREEILHSGKEQSELLMITDLERNDLGRVCEFGSVKVLQQRVIEQYTTVYQAISTVEGTLQADKDCFDILKACFPGGSITGCPKIKAMQIIEELEPTRRSIYTGAFGYISFNGNMDFNIMIRTILATQDHYHVQVGAGIVAESTPEAEYAETLVKAQAMQACLEALKKTAEPGRAR